MSIIVECSMVFAVQCNPRQPAVCVSNTSVRVCHAECNILRNCCAFGSLLCL